MTNTENNVLPSYYAIITADVRYDARLSNSEKLLYGEITALYNMNGRCYAGNSYFAKLYGVDTSTIQRWLKSLEDFGYINRVIIRKKDSAEVEERHIEIVNISIPHLKNEVTPHLKNEQDNNTINNKLLIDKNNNLTDSNRSGFDKQESIIKWDLIKPELLDSFKPLIEEFIQYRKESKKSMNIKAINIFINRLLKYSNENIEIATQLIEEAILKNWQSIYEPKPNQYSPQSKEPSNNKGSARPATSATDRFKAMVWGDEWKEWYGAVCAYEDINKVFESNRIELCVDDKFLTNFKGFYDSYNKTNIAMDEAGYMLPTNHFHKPENFRGALIHPFTQTSYSFDSWLAMYVQYLKFRFSDITKVYAGHFDINGKIFDDFLESDWFEDQKIKTNDVARRRAKYINEAEMAKNKLDKEK